MFTGIVRAMGTVADIETRRGDLRMRIECPALPWQDYAAGESISVNGVCLTASELGDRGFTFDVSRETLDVTTLGNLERGAKVNIEPALTLAERLGGHLVSGHVDGIGTVTDRREDARSTRLRIEMPSRLGRYVAQKGSICVDGVSLTINEVSGDAFTTNIIPHTARVTIIGDYRPGTKVNIEVDLIARYLESLMNGESGGRLSRSFLEANGYA